MQQNSDLVIFCENDSKIVHILPPADIENSYFTLQLTEYPFLTEKRTSMSETDFKKIPYCLHRKI